MFDFHPTGKFHLHFDIEDGEVILIGLSLDHLLLIIK